MNLQIWILMMNHMSDCIFDREKDGNSSVHGFLF